jgi:O-acetylhomoserine/O-acetylserine sulfhydrylase-like pyridoxal-dependent enzyme
MHSATKYLNGHSDVVAGAVVGRKTFLSENRDPSETRQTEVWRRLLRARSFGGSVLGPFEAWLLLRGARTLHVRVTRQCESAMFLAKKLIRTRACRRCSTRASTRTPATLSRRNSRARSRAKITKGCSAACSVFGARAAKKRRC